MVGSLIFNQSTPSTTWTISHDLVGVPVCDVLIEENGDIVKMLPLSVVHTEGQLVISFSQPTAGQARLAGKYRFVAPTTAGSIDAGQLSTGLTVSAGALGGIDFGQGPMPVDSSPPPPTTISFYNPYDGVRPFDYLTPYEAATGTSIQQHAFDSFDTSLTGNYSLYDSNFGVSFTGAGAVYAPNGSSTPDGFTAFEVNIEQEGLAVGLVSQYFADAQQPFGGAAFAAYQSNGTYNVNGTITTGLPTYGAGDTIGVVVELFSGGYDDTVVRFFKNGTLVYTTPQLLSFTLRFPVVSTLPAAPSGPNYVFQLRTLESEMTHANVYEADYPSATQIGGTYDTGVVAADTTFVSNKLVQITSANRSQIGSVSVSSGTAYWEFLIGNDALNTYVGIYPNFAGPPFDADNNNWQYGSPVASYYKSNGEVFGYGSGTVANGPTFGQGDVIGVVFEADFSRVWFYKNGVKITTPAPLANNNISLTSGTYS